MNSVNWLIQPIAHRGLHDASRGIIENTASAFQAAIDAGYAIETDVQASQDGEAMVFHDATLDRLTEAAGMLNRKSAKALRRVRYRETPDKMQTLKELLDQIDGRVPLIIEVKSEWKEQGPLERRIAELVGARDAQIAVMSFDPKSVAAFAQHAPRNPRGLVACRFANPEHWPGLSPARRFAYRHLLSSVIARPHFIAYDIDALPALAPWITRSLFRLPVLTWTVRNAADREKAKRWADAIIFEGIRP